MNNRDAFQGGRNLPSRPVNTNSTTNNGHLTAGQRALSLPVINGVQAGRSPILVRSIPPPRNNGSVRHLTCYWWNHRGGCRFSDEECAYAHYDTGRYATEPRQVIPGQPAMAGRRLERVTHSLAAQNPANSPASLNIDHIRNPNNTPVYIPNIRALNMSRPGSPVFHIPSSDTPSPPHVPSVPSRSVEGEVQKLERDRDFFRELLASALREKKIFMDEIDRLKEENKQLKDNLQLAEENIAGYQGESLGDIHSQNIYGVIGSQPPRHPRNG